MHISFCGAHGSIYSGAKAAVRALARGLTPELAKVGARINVLSPGPVDTPIHANRGLNEKEVDEFWALFTKLPAGRVGDPTEMAKAALFLGPMIHPICSAVKFRLTAV